MKEEGIERETMGARGTSAHTHTHTREPSSGPGLDGVLTTHAREGEAALNLPQKHKVYSSAFIQIHTNRFGRGSSRRLTWSARTRLHAFAFFSCVPISSNSTRGPMSFPDSQEGCTSVSAAESLQLLAGILKNHISVHTRRQ